MSHKKPTREETLAFARELLKWGIPVIVCKPNAKNDEAVPIVAWENITSAEQCRAMLDRFEHGKDALALIGGYGIDLIDVDVKTDPPGSIEPFGEFAHFGVTRTPSGGWHYVVASTGLRCKTKVEIDGQPVGDYVGGTAEHKSRMLGFLPGSVRPKYKDVMYGFEEPWDIESAVLGEPDPQVLATLDKAGVGRDEEREVFIDDSPERDPSLGVHRYARKAIESELQRLDDLPRPWAPGSYWDNTTFEVACQLVRFANSHWTGYSEDDALADLLQRAPSDDQWGAREHNAKWRQARSAVGDGGRENPDRRPEQEFVPVVLPPSSSPRTEISDLFTAAPSIFLGDTKALNLRGLTGHIDRALPLGFDAVTRRLMTFRGGVWHDGEEDVAHAIHIVFDDDWNPTRRNTLLEHMRDNPGLPRPSREPVAPEYVNCRNGMVRWETGEVEPHDPGLLSTVQIPWDYDPLATCPAFDAFLAAVLPDAETVAFMWEVLGYLLFSGNPFQKAVLLKGEDGRNGKGTLLRVVQALVGSLNYSAVNLHALADNRFMVAELYGRLLNVAGDLDSRIIGNTGQFKSITGEDQVNAEQKYGQPFSFTPWCVMVFSANETFGANDSSAAYFARWLVVPFPNSFEGKEDAGLTNRLTTPAELQGVLARALDGLRTLMARGRFEEPEAVRAAKAAFVRESDHLHAWLERKCFVGNPEDFATRPSLWLSYSLDDETGAALPKQKFYKALRTVGHGVREGKRNGREGFYGLALRHDEE